MRTVLTTVALVLALAGVARADGDPASDVLISQDAYYPYAPPTTAKYKKALDATLKKARDAGFPMKVALIATEADLGAYPTLFNHPQDYANLLSRELPQNRHGPKLEDQHVLAVMPGGFGGNNLGDKVDAALNRITIQADAQSDGLAVAAIAAVSRLATANGHPVPLPPEGKATLAKTNKSTKRSGPSPLVYLGPALLLFAGIAVAGRIASRRARQDTATDAES